MIGRQPFPAASVAVAGSIVLFHLLTITSSVPQSEGKVVCFFNLSRSFRRNVSVFTFHGHDSRLPEQIGRQG